MVHSSGGSGDGGGAAGVVGNLAVEYPKHTTTKKESPYHFAAYYTARLVG